MQPSNGLTAILKYHSTKKSMKAPRIIAERFIQQSFPAICFDLTVTKIAKKHGNDIRSPCAVLVFC